jgi:hypothetical protein
LQGAQGIQGVPGAQGSTGPQGVQGVMGLQGVPGVCQPGDCTGGGGAACERYANVMQPHANIKIYINII